MPEGLWRQLVAAQDMYGSMGLEDAVGLPAILAVIRFLSHAAGMVPMNVIQKTGTVNKVADTTWQHNLLNMRPGPPPTTPFNFQADLAANFAGRGNAYIRKLKPTAYRRRLSTGETPRVTELISLHAPSITPKRINTGALVFVDSTGDTPVDRTTAEIIQVRSMAVSRDGLTGVSPITAARTFVSAGLKRNQFEDRHLSNGIAPSLAVAFPRGMQEDQAGRWLDMIEEKHAGSAKAGKILGFPDGSNPVSLPISLADALFAEMTNLTMSQACAMYQIPLAIMCPASRPLVTDDDYRFFVTWALGPILIALAQAYRADDDLFVPGEDDKLNVKPDTDSLLLLDALKKAQVGLSQVQSGQRLPDELRGADGIGPLPPVPEDWTQHPGQVPQITPVGGAPNPEVDTSQPAPSSPVQEEEDDAPNQA